MYFKKTTLLFCTLLLSLLLGIASLPARVLSAGEAVIFDDMEHGDPFANGWFAFGGSVGGGGIGPNADVPPTNGGAFSLDTGWGSGGVPGFFGGFGRTNPVDLTGTDTFSFWINPVAGQAYTLEINLQDDDNGDGVINPPDDDEFQFNCVVSDTGPCAVSGDGWQLVSIPLADFFDDGSFLFGGNGVLDATPTADGGNGQLINVVFAVISTGPDVNFRTDYWAFSAGDISPTVIIDDFENGLPTGFDPNGLGVGFVTFSDGSPNFIATTDTPPAAVPDSAVDNTVLAMTGEVASFAGFVHAFENAAVDTWVSQDWSTYEGLSFWFYGQNSGTTIFIDVIDNRKPGSTTDDGERFTVSFADDFSGWRFFEVPFADFVRKDIGNGAPNDGLTLTQVWGYAFGTLNTPGEITHYIDDVAVYGVAEIPDLAVTFATAETEITEGTTGDVIVKLNRPMNSDDPAEVSVDYFTEEVGAIAGRDYESTSGTLTFVNGGPSELTIPITTLEDTKWEGTERVILRLTNPVDVEAGFFMQGAAAIVDNDEFDPNLLDDFEYGAYQWDSSEYVTLTALGLESDDELARPEQDAFETVLQVDAPLMVDITIEGNTCKKGNGIIPVVLYSSDSFDATAVDHTTVTFGNAAETHGQRHAEDANGDGLIDLVFHFRANELGVDCNGVIPFLGEMFDGQMIAAGIDTPSFSRDFPIGDDWSNGEALTFWYYGSGSGEEVVVNLKDNRAPDPGPSGWDLVWSEEFNEAAGTPPNPEYWSFEIGDGTVNGIPGWGNDEFQYYTDDPANAATDGNGNMVLTVREADGSLECYYGPCAYTSARLISWRKAEFAYGRIESRILVPDGGSGIWPAFWSLGTDIDVVEWPQTGEIDFMEYVSRIPNEIFGTIHGPGYSGGQSYGNEYDFGEPVSNSYHTFTIEWEPDSIKWYVDGILYHTAAPQDVAPNEWVFNDPVFLLLNIAMGGNFGGTIDPSNQYPQSMAVDYIRVYQGPDTAERFEATFTDNFEGWQQIEVPFTAFARSADQPAGAPDDGLTLSEVWGYGFTLPSGGPTLVDLAAVKPAPPPEEVTVTTASATALRAALDLVADNGTVLLDPSLAGSTISVNGPLVLDRSVTIAGAGLDITLDGGGFDRVLIVDAGVEATVKGLTLANGYGFQLGGGVINNGTLTLEGVTVTGNIMTTDAGDFWQGGGGIYNGDGASLTLIDSTVSDNSSGWSGGGIYSFFNTTTTLINSVVSDNVAADVGGGLRTLGNATIDNSTISHNTSVGWHGGGMFITDGVVDVVNGSLVTENSAPGGTTGGLFVGTFGPSSATLNIGGSIVVNNSAPNCFAGYFGAGAVALNSLGGNIFTDSTCNPVASDIVDPGFTP